MSTTGGGGKGRGRVFARCGLRVGGCYIVTRSRVHFAAVLIVSSFLVGIFCGNCVIVPF